MKIIKRIIIILTIQIIIILAIFLAYTPPTEFNKTAFISDGCSMFPDTYHYECCYIHDKGYWDGGSSEDRLKVDSKFKQCVADISGDFVANSMYLGVRFGGHPIFPTPWRWNFGIPYKKGY